MCIVAVLCVRKNTDITLSTQPFSLKMYKGRCAECNAVWNSKAFRSRPAGRDIPVPDE
jgi:hypothetical protein